MEEVCKLVIDIAWRLELFLKLERDNALVRDGQIFVPFGRVTVNQNTILMTNTFWRATQNLVSSIVSNDGRADFVA